MAGSFDDILERYGASGGATSTRQGSTKKKKSAYSDILEQYSSGGADKPQQVATTTVQPFEAVQKAPESEIVRKRGYDPKERLKQQQEQAQRERGLFGKQTTLGRAVPKFTKDDQGKTQFQTGELIDTVAEGVKAGGDMYAKATEAIVLGNSVKDLTDRKMQHVETLIQASKRNPEKRDKYLKMAQEIAAAKVETADDLENILQEYKVGDEGITAGTVKKVAGKSGQLAVEVAGAGAFQKVAKGGKLAVQSGRLAKGAKVEKLATTGKEVLKRGAKAAATGYGYGTAYGASRRVGEGGDVGESIKEAAIKEGPIGAAFAGVVGTTSAAGGYRKTTNAIIKNPKRLEKIIRKTAEKEGADLSDEKVAKLVTQYQAAPAKKVQIDALAEDIAKEIPGARVKTTPIKGTQSDNSFNPARAIAKSLEDDGGEVRDLARNTIVVDTIDDAQKASKAFEARGVELKPEKNFFNNPTDLGYKGIGINHSDDIGKAEIQVNIPEMIYYKEAPDVAKNIIGDELYGQLHKAAQSKGLPGGRGHEIYEKVRDIDAIADAAGRFEVVSGTNGVPTKKYNFTPEENAIRTPLLKESRAGYSVAEGLRGKVAGAAAPASGEAPKLSGNQPPRAVYSASEMREPPAKKSAKNGPSVEKPKEPSSSQATPSLPSKSQKAGTGKPKSDLVDRAVIQSKSTAKPEKTQGTITTRSTPTKKPEAEIVRPKEQKVAPIVRKKPVVAAKKEKVAFKTEDVEAKPEAFQLSRRLETLNKEGAEDYKVSQLLKNFDESRIADNKIDVVRFSKDFEGTIDGKKVSFKANKPYVVSGHNRLAALKKAKAAGQVKRPDGDFFSSKLLPGSQDALDQVIDESIATNVRNKSVKEINIIDLAIKGRVTADDMSEALAHDPKRVKFMQDIVSTFRDNNLEDFWSKSVGKKLAQLKDLDFGVMQERLNFVNRIGKKLSQTMDTLTPAQQTALKDTLASKVSEMMSLSKASTLRGVEQNITRHLDSIRTGGFSTEKLTTLFGETVSQSTVAKTSGVQATEKAIAAALKSNLVPSGTKAALRKIGGQLRDPDVAKFINERAGGSANSRKTQGLLDDLVTGKLDLPKGKASPFIVPKQKAAQSVELPRTKSENIRSGDGGITIKKSPEAALSTTKKKLSFPQTVKKSKTAKPSLKARIKERALTYNVENQEATMAEARKIINEGGDDTAWELAMGKDQNSLTNAVGMHLMNDYQQKGDYNKAFTLLEKIGDTARKQGQANAILAAWKRLTPEGALRYAQKVVADTRRDMVAKEVRRAVSFEREAALVAKGGREKLAARFKLPHLSEATAKKITDQAKRVQSLPEGRQRDVAVARLMDTVAAQIPVGWGKRISTIQSMSLLLNPKTFVRNIGGNTGMVALENVSDVIGAGYDKIIGIVTRRRTAALPSVTGQLRGGWKGIKTGVADSIMSIDTSPGAAGKYDLVGRTFRGKYNPLTYAEKLLNLELRAPDRAAYEAAYQGSLVKQLKVAKMNKVANPVVTPEMHEKAVYEGLYRTFQDSNRATKFSLKIKETLNLVGTKNFGLGDLVHKFPQVPANILARSSDYTVGGAVKVIYHMVRPIAGKTFDQQALVSALSRTTVGGGVLYAGYILGKTGIATGGPDEDFDIKNVQMAAGDRGYQVNLNALKRWFASGFDDEAAKQKEGDVKASYDWALPASSALAMGVIMGQQDAGWLALPDAYSAIAEPLTEQGVVTGVTRFARTVGQYDNVGKGATKALTEAAIGAPAMFVPTVSNQFRQLEESKARGGKARETYDPNPLKESINKAVTRIPYLSRTLRPKIDIWGNEQDTFQTGKESGLNVFVNPAITTEVFNTPEATMVLDLWANTGEKTQAPRTMRQKISVGSEQVQLDADQYEKMKRYTGTRSRLIFRDLAKDKRFRELPETAQVKVLAGLLTDIGTAAKIEVLDYKPKTKVDKGVLAVMNGKYYFKWPD